jgi:hypothetical protein
MISLLRKTNFFEKRVGEYEEDKELSTCIDLLMYCVFGVKK